MFSVPALGDSTICRQWLKLKEKITLIGFTYHYYSCAKNVNFEMLYDKLI